MQFWSPFNLSFSNVQLTSVKTTSSSSNSPAANGKGGSTESAQDDGSVDDLQFEESLAPFGLKRRTERKNQRDERKRPGKNKRRMTQFSGKACRNCRNRETELQACSSP